MKCRSGMKWEFLKCLGLLLLNYVVITTHFWLLHFFKAIHVSASSVTPRRRAVPSVNRLCASWINLLCINIFQSIYSCSFKWMDIKFYTDIAVDKKMLRMALIILAKRHGARWCQNYIVKNMLLPIIEQSRTPERVKCFCVSLLGPLLKPYPMEMKVHCEIVMNQLSDLLNGNRE